MQPGSDHVHKAWQLQAKLCKHTGRQWVSFPSTMKGGTEPPLGEDFCPLSVQMSAPHLFKCTFACKSSFAPTPASH